MRDLLTAACFSSHPINLNHWIQCHLSNLDTQSRYSLGCFHSRVLTSCNLVVNVGFVADLPRLLASLDCFIGCRAVTLNERAYGTRLSDPDLYALVHHPTIVACAELDINRGFYHNRAKLIRVDVKEAEQAAELRITRQMKRKRDSRVYSRTKQFDWAEVSFPSITRLCLPISGRMPYIGGAAFLTAHTALLSLEMSKLVAHVDELTAIFQDSSALPRLTRFGLYSPYEEGKHAYCLTALLTALATTV